MVFDEKAQVLITVASSHVIYYRSGNHDGVIRELMTQKKNG